MASLCCLKNCMSPQRISPLFHGRNFLVMGTRFLSGLKYAKTHEWAQLKNGLCTVGLSKFAVDTIGDVVYIDFPHRDSILRKGEPFGNVESSKATSELFAPISGVVEQINEAARDKPSLLNKSPEKDGWLLKIRPTEPQEINSLMSEKEYKDFISNDEC